MYENSVTSTTSALVGRKDTNFPLEHKKKKRTYFEKKKKKTSRADLYINGSYSLSLTKDPFDGKVGTTNEIFC